jgi:hypothetical protein
MSEQDVIRYVKAGSLIAVPYDMGPDFSPVLRNGEKAHWCLICGFILFSHNKVEIKVINLDEEPLNDELCLDTIADLHVIAIHGKSKTPGIWKFDTLKSSNSNLERVGQKVLDGRYVYPDGGSLAGLCGKWMVIGS